MKTQEGERAGHVVGFALVCVLSALAIVGSSVGARAPGADIVRLDRGAAPTEHGIYPAEMVVKTDAFDGSYASTIGYRSEDRRFTVAVWESGPGTLKSDGYPRDEYCRVLEGHLVVTNASGRREEFGPGDTFVIPKGWAGSWNMTTRFKKQYVAFEESR